MQWLYKTAQGDTWDSLAFDIYGSEKLMHILIEANPKHIDTLIFGVGVELIIPQTPPSTINQLKAPWDD